MFYENKTLSLMALLTTHMLAPFTWKVYFDAMCPFKEIRPCVKSNWWAYHHGIVDNPNYFQ
jgi:hypothetical protein